MQTHHSAWRAVLATALAVLALETAAANEVPVGNPFVKGALVQVDVYDRADGTALSTYQRGSDHFIVGTPGHEYAVRIRNCTGARVLVVTSVDGVNVISGDTAAPSQSGYVLEPWASVEVAGWRKSMNRTAAFFFTEHQNSYAERTGRPDNVGVIGVAVFQERARRIAWREPEMRGKLDVGEADSRRDRTAQSPAAPAAAPMESRAADNAVREEKQESAAGRMAKLGTGHGRNEDSRVTLTNFERATDSPAETVAIRYDRRANLIAMGVLPAPAPRMARRDPDPFPGALRFAPDPVR